MKIATLIIICCMIGGCVENHSVFNDSYSPTVSYSNENLSDLTGVEATPRPQKSPYLYYNNVNTPVPPPVSVSTETEQRKVVVVFVTKTGNKYHKNGCRYLKQSKISIGLSKAKENGYCPCSVCKPHHHF